MSCLAAHEWCICVLEDHDGPHICSCGGSWDEKDGEFVVVRLPGEMGDRYGGDVIGALMGFLGFDDEPEDDA